MILHRAGLEVVGEADNGGDAVTLADIHRPDVALLEVTLPVSDGLTAAQAIARVSPATSILMLTAHAEERRVLAALHSGIRGYVTKTHVSSELAVAIRTVVAGRVFVSREARRGTVAEYLDTGRTADPLSAQDLLLLQMIADGYTSAGIARMLHVSPRTAQTRRARLYARLQVRDTVALVRCAVRAGLIQAVYAALITPFGVLALC